jgi:hypothetical protein
MSTASRSTGVPKRTSTQAAISATTTSAAYSTVD